MRGREGGGRGRGGGGAVAGVDLSPIWEVSHGGEEGVLGVEDPCLAHVPNFESCH